MFSILQSIADYYRVLRSITEYNRVLQSTTEYYGVLKGTTECYGELQSVTECCRLLQSVTECYRVLEGVTECNRVLQSVTWCYRVLQSRVAEVAWGRGGPPPKVWPRTKIVSPNIGYFFRELRIVAIYALFGDLWAKEMSFWVKNSVSWARNALLHGIYSIFYCKFVITRKNDACYRVLDTCRLFLAHLLGPIFGLVSLNFAHSLLLHRPLLSPYLSCYNNRFNLG